MKKTKELEFRVLNFDVKINPKAVDKAFEDLGRHLIRYGEALIRESVVQQKKRRRHEKVSKNHQ